MTAECRLYLITPPKIDDLAAFGRTWLGRWTPATWRRCRSG